MVKKLTVLALAGTLALPAAALAGGGAADMQNQIDALTRQLEQLKSQLAKMQDDQADIKETQESFEEKAEGWDLASRVHISGDFRARGDYLTSEAPSHYTALQITDALTSAAFQANFGGPFFGLASVPREYDQLKTVVAGMKAFTPLARAQTLAGLGVNPIAPTDYDNDWLWSNRLRLNLRAKATENVEFKGRLAMYKSWGMQNNPVDYTYNAGNGGGPFMLSSLTFDGSSGRQPKDNTLVVDRAIINWNNIAGLPMWFSIGRRPTTDGPPNQLRLGLDERMASPSAYMNYAFDGLTLGYAYNNLFGMEDAPGRIRFCYGRGFESGPTDQSDGSLEDDVDFGGLSWDIYNKGDQFIYLQSFGAFNIFNVPDNVTFVNPYEFSVWQAELAATGSGVYFDPLNREHNLILDRDNLGNIFHTAAVYMDKYQDLNYFIHAGWSHTDPQGTDELGNGLLSSWYDEPTSKDGYSVHLGVRYDLNDLGLKLGAEYNYGSEYWISFTPAHDDLYQSKLATRGHVYEVYGIYDLPTGEAISKYGKVFMRLGYQHYEYNYTGSGFWLGAPYDVDDLASDPFTAQFYVPVDSADQVYLTMEAFF